MIDKQFDKETFKKSVKDNVKFLYRRKLEEATQEQLFQAVSYTVKDVSSITGLIHRMLMKSRIRRSYTICLWISYGTCPWKQPFKPWRIR